MLAPRGYTGDIRTLTQAILNINQTAVAQVHFERDTLDDVMHDVLTCILDSGTTSHASRGAHREILGVQIEIANPLARISRTETRSKLFSSLGELLWYLSGSDNLKFIKHYIPNYEHFADEYGAYGPRLTNSNGQNQINNVIALLTKRSSSRRAVIQLFEPRDIARRRFNVPCTCTLQYLIRNGRLHAITYMRSNDAYIGLPHDVFSFTMLQEIFARTLDVELGTYKHFVGSMHLYERHVEQARLYLEEGFQSTNYHMRHMPKDSPWFAINKLLRAEQDIRQGKDPNLEGFDSYWKTLALLLRLHYLRKEDKWKDVLELLENGAIDTKGFSHVVSDLRSEVADRLDAAAQQNRE